MQDSPLNSIQHRLWALVQEVLLRWQILVPFEHVRMDVPRGWPERITFFVPVDATHRYEVEAFLEHELAALRRDDMEDDRLPTGTFPGTKASVEPFRGMMPHIDRDTAERLAREAASVLLQRLRERPER